MQVKISKAETDQFFKDFQTTSGPKELYLNVLKNLFALYQEGNENHFLIKPILDKRFCNSPDAFESWKNLCKMEVLEIYRSQIRTSLREYSSSLFTKALKDIHSAKSNSEHSSPAPS